jgi:glutathione S-transferase
MATLYIGNKNYSSWSFRPWLGMMVAGVPFEEKLVPFNNEGKNPEFAAFSPTAQVPVLVDGELTIWQSLAILDHVARVHPESGLWPAEPAARSKAMAVSCEMMSSFFALRGACPMNMRREQSAIAVTDALRVDVDRIETIWNDCLTQSGGPYLFGAFSIADAMYAPVVNRLDVYAIPVGEGTRAHMDTMKALPQWQAWEAAARAEPWVVEADEA